MYVKPDMEKLLTAIFILGLTACSQTKPNTEFKTLNFGLFTIETPQAWAKVKVHGIDSYVGRIAIDDKDTLDFDLGWYSNSLYEYDPNILDSSLISQIDTNDVNFHSYVFVKSRKAVDPDEYRKNNVSWDTIDGRRAKVVYPRISGIGVTGVYIDSLWQAGMGVDRFNLYGTNLKPDNEWKVLQALRTLKFHKK